MSFSLEADCYWLATSLPVTLSATWSAAVADEEADNSGSRLGAALAELILDPQRMITYMLLFALVVAIIVRFDLPGEFWALLGGVITGAAQAVVKSRGNKEDKRD